MQKRTENEDPKGYRFYPEGDSPINGLRQLVADIDGAMTGIDIDQLWARSRRKVIQRLLPLVGDFDMADAWAAVNLLKAESAMGNPRDDGRLLFPAWVLEDFVREGRAGNMRSVRARLASLRQLVEDDGGMDESCAGPAIGMISVDMDAVAARKFEAGEHFVHWAARSMGEYDESGELIPDETPHQAQAAE